ncbi:MAG TPA: hypothetical protein VIO87_03315 [Methylotenera sp.]
MLKEIKPLLVIFLCISLILGCSKKNESEHIPPAANNSTNQEKLDGVDLSTVIQKIASDSTTSNSAPNPTTIKDAFAPCTLNGMKGNLTGYCPIYADGVYLIDVDDNSKHDKNVRITTKGSRFLINYIQLDSENPNHIHYSLNEERYKQTPLECNDERVGSWEFKNVKTSNKKDFVIAINKNISARNGWGWLRIYLDGTNGKDACQQIANEEMPNSENNQNFNQTNSSQSNTTNNTGNENLANEIYKTAEIRKYPKESYPSYFAATRMGNKDAKEKLFDLYALFMEETKSFLAAKNDKEINFCIVKDALEVGFPGVKELLLSHYGTSDLNKIYRYGDPVILSCRNTEDRGVDLYKAHKEYFENKSIGSDVEIPAEQIEFETKNNFKEPINHKFKFKNWIAKVSIEQKIVGNNTMYRAQESGVYTDVDGSKQTFYGNPNASLDVLADSNNHQYTIELIEDPLTIIKSGTLIRFSGEYTMECRKVMSCHEKIISFEKIQLMPNSN